LQFEVDADDYIVAVQVTYDNVFGQDSDIITSITFNTFKGKTSPPYGLETQKKFVLKDKNGGKLVGFHGRAGEALYALGAYFATTTTPVTPAKKLSAIGGDEGTAWDDGAYDGVKKVYVGQGQDGISAVKFEYNKGAENIVGGEHGKPTLLGFEEVFFVFAIKIQNMLYLFIFLKLIDSKQIDLYDLKSFNCSLRLTIQVNTSPQLKAPMIKSLGVMA